ncbi:MAG: magnesium transporter CorA family protein [Saprospiraceae bacterium]|uniref:Magnesium transporter CorA family protein n=1 Tax=Candidatus Opimibacter skivensis TaxID=2982028 RepID=A0A9D7SSN5_9BACT|nr:magnesium transporter CorA family protein [Candidatus Opimibacter skivensis]
MTRYYHIEDGRLTELDKPVLSCWINVTPPFEPSELEGLAEEHAIPIDFLTDALDVDERSRYEREDDIRLILVNTPMLNEIDKDNEAIYITAPIGIILTQDHVLTICQYENPILQRFIDGRIKGFDPSNEQMFVLNILEQNVMRFMDSLKKLNIKRNMIERELYNSSRNSEIQQLLRIEKSLVYFVNTLSSNELLNMKIKRTDFLRLGENEEEAEFFDDIIIDNGQALSMANIYTNILSGTMDAYTSIISNNLGLFIQRLTIITIILMVPTLVASFFGMNVRIPFEDTKGAFYIVLILATSLSLLLVWFFRRKNLF